MFDKICRGDPDNLVTGLAQYGIKLVRGENLLSGPGLPADDETGITKYYGSKWPERLGNKCGEMIGEFSEDEMHQAFVAGDSLFEKFCVEDCTEDGIELRREDFLKKVKMEVDRERSGDKRERPPSIEKLDKKPESLEGGDILERASTDGQSKIVENPEGNPNLSPNAGEDGLPGMAPDPPATHSEL